MPLYGASNGGKRKKPHRQKEIPEWMKSSSSTDEDGCVLTLTCLSLLSLADNMNTVWVKDYAEKYLDQYLFRHIMGPFNILCAELVEELIKLLCTRKKLSRGALDLLLVPQLRTLSLETCPGLATSTVCTQIAARCQLLSNLDISGAQQLSSKVLSQMLLCLPKLRSLSFAGTTSDKSVIRAVAQNCPLLRHLDVCRCHLLTPAALLLLGGGVPCVSSHESSPSKLASCSTSTISAALSPLPLNSLLALDIGFEEQEGDTVAVAAYLLLTLSGLEKFAVEGLAQACQLIFLGRLDQTDKFTAKQGVPRLEDIWKQRMQSQDNIDWKNDGKARETEKNEYYRKDDTSESEEDSSVDPGICPSQGRDRLTLRLRDVRVLSCESLVSLGHLCPNIIYISVNADYPDTIQISEIEHLTKAIQSFSGQLKSLSVQYSGLVNNLHRTVHAAGSSLLSLILEGVKTSYFSHVSLLRVLQSCPRLTELSISAEHTQSAFHLPEVVNDDRIDWNLLHLPNLCMLTLRFSFEHDQMKPNTVVWICLKAILRCLLARSPVLQRVTLVSLPCPLNSVLQDVLHTGNIHHFDSLPLRCLKHLDVQRTDIQMTTVSDLIKHNKRLKYVDVRNCWNISRSEWMDSLRSGNVEVVWV